MAEQPRRVRFIVDINQGAYGTGDFPGLFDMLRYEGGRVIDWTKVEGLSKISYSLVIECELRHHAPERWKSFGITPQGATPR